MPRFILCNLMLSTALLYSPALGAKQLDFGLPPNFVAEEIYEVPNDEQGSWICLAVDDRGRLIASDQKGALYRLTVPEVGHGNAAKVEQIHLDIGMAMGLLYAHDSLYVMVNGRSADGPGLYRLRDTNHDDQFDSVELLRAIEPPGNPGAGHGNHAIVLGPDEESLFIVCGNMAGFPAGGFDSSRVPRNWGEDQLLPRMPDGRGHAARIMAPGGWIAETDLDGRHWELVCSGFRNVYDAAFNRAGDLFTYDADMEFDLGTPWYRPTRVCHVVSGGEYGWRNGSGKWPAYYPDSLPATVDIGLGSPTGVTFGYDTNFPNPYRNSLFICDWSYGRIYLVDLERSGATYRGQQRLFASYAPLPVVDLVANPLDGAFYLVTGGRGVQSHVYRIRFTGQPGAKLAEPGIAPRTDPQIANGLHAQRQELEELHAPREAAAVDRIWPDLDHRDRFVRYAARIALEQQPVKHWQDRLSSETDPQTTIAAVIAAARCAKDMGQLLQMKLYSLPLEELSHDRKAELLRAYGLVFIRQGRPSKAFADELGRRLLRQFPSDESDLDRELSRMLAYLRPQGTIEATLRLLEEVESPEDQMHHAAMLRVVDDGWSIDQRRRYFAWFRKAATYVGGRSNGEFAQQIREDAESTLDVAERSELADLLSSLDEPSQPDLKAEPRPVVKKWTVAELIPNRDTTWQETISQASDIERGERLFSVATCHRCHQVRGQGGRVGPNLSGATRRFSPYDLLETIIEPSKAIPHEFQAVTVVTVDGKVVTGQVINFGKGGMSVRTDPLQPWKSTRIAQGDIEEISPSKVSQMPTGLIDVLQKQEIFDLLGWLASQ